MLQSRSALQQLKSWIGNDLCSKEAVGKISRFHPVANFSAFCALTCGSTPRARRKRVNLLHYGSNRLKKESMQMMQIVRKKNIVAMFLVLAFVILTATVDGLAHRRPYRHHHSKTKGAVIGGVAGAVGGALIGGKKGAVIGAGAGAGTGYLVQRHRNRKQRRYIRRR